MCRGNVFEQVIPSFYFVQRGGGGCEIRLEKLHSPGYHISMTPQRKIKFLLFG